MTALLPEIVVAVVAMGCTVLYLTGRMSEVRCLAILLFAIAGYITDRTAINPPPIHDGCRPSVSTPTPDTGRNDSDE